MNYSRFSEAQYTKYSFIQNIKVDFDAVKVEREIIHNRLKVINQIDFSNITNLIDLFESFLGKTVYC